VSVKLELNGMAELREALRNLPETLAGEASHIVEGVANGVASDVRRAYPSRSGRLIGGVQVTRFETGKVAAGAIVKSAAKHAHLFEYGTASRRTSKGVNRGRMPKAPQNERMVPIVVRARKRMYSQFAEMLRRIGFVVEGL
jgi:hypothetical protein